MMLYVVNASMVYGSSTLVHLHLHEQHKPTPRDVSIPRFRVLIDGTNVTAWLLPQVFSGTPIACCGSSEDAKLLSRLTNTTIHLELDSDPIEDAALLHAVSENATGLRFVREE